MAKVWCPAGSSVLAASQLESVAVSGDRVAAGRARRAGSEGGGADESGSGEEGGTDGHGFSRVRVMVVSRR